MMKKILIIILLILMVNVRIVKGSEMFSSASSMIVMESKSERIIYQKNIHDIHLTASICKILTCITAIEYGDLEKWCTVTKEVTLQKGSSIYLELNDKIKLIDLLYGLMLRSGNDAAYLIACSCGGYENFIVKMNEVAKKIGMKSSTFANPSGLDDQSQNYSTAYDMALLMKYCTNNKLFMKINSTKTYVCETYNNKKMYFTNKHRLIQSNDFVIGGKTGYTEKAKRTLVTYATNKELDIIVVSFNCGNDFNEHLNFINYCFNNFKMYVVLKKQIIKVNDNYVTYTPVVLENIEYPITKEELHRISCIIELYKKPTSFNIVGKAKIYYDNEIVKEVKVYRYY